MMFWLVVSILPAVAIVIFLLQEISKIVENLQKDIDTERLKYQEIRAKIVRMENSESIRQCHDYNNISQTGYAQLLNEERIGEPIDLRYCPVSPVDSGVPGRNSLSARYRAAHSGSHNNSEKTPVSAEQLRNAFENLFGDILARPVVNFDNNIESTGEETSQLHFTQARPLTLQSAKSSAPTLIPRRSLFVPNDTAVDTVECQKLSQPQQLQPLQLQPFYLDMTTDGRSQLFDELLQKTRKVSAHDEMSKVERVESPKRLAATSPPAFDYVSPRDQSKFDSKDRILQSIKREAASLSPTNSNSSGRNSSNSSPFRSAPVSPPPPPPPLASPPIFDDPKTPKTPPIQVRSKPTTTTTTTITSDKVETQSIQVRLRNDNSVETASQQQQVRMVPSVNKVELSSAQTEVKSLRRHFERSGSDTNPPAIVSSKRFSVPLKTPTQMATEEKLKPKSPVNVAEFRTNLPSKEDLPDLIRPSNGVKNDKNEREKINSLSPVIMGDYVTPVKSSHHYEVDVNYAKPADNNSAVSDSSACRDWDPSQLISNLYRIDYQPREEELQPNFTDMEGSVEHLPMGMKTMAISKAWKSHYFRTNKGRLEWFEGDKAEGKILGELSLAGAEVERFEEENQNFLKIHGGRDGGFLILRIYSEMILDKWRLSLLSHAAKSLETTYVQPTYPPTANYTKKVAIIELGNCSIRAGLLTIEPSLPQTYFPCVALELPEGGIVVGSDAYAPQLRHRGNLTLPTNSNQTNVNRYAIDTKIVTVVFDKVFKDLKIKAQDYQVLLSIPQTTPPHLIGELMGILLNQFKCKGVSMAKQSILSLYAYDITTGVVVDIGDRLNIVPVIDGYIVHGGVVSLPHGGGTVAEELRTKIGENNSGLYAFVSPVEKLILRYIMEEACYIAEDFEKEVEEYSRNPSTCQKLISLEQFSLTPDMQKEFNLDAARFTSTEGWINPKKWGLDVSGLHKLIHNSVHASPMDSRRTLYRNVYLTGGGTMLSGLARRLEREISKLVASSIQVQVHCSPWRNHAAFIGAQILAGTQQFEETLVTEKTLAEFQRKLYASVF